MASSSSNAASPQPQQPHDMPGIAVCVRQIESEPRESLLRRLARLRLLDGLSVYEADTEIWLWHPSPDDHTELLLRGIGGERFSVLADRSLVPWHRSLPVDFLSEGPWHPLRHWLELNMETATFPGQVASKVTIGLRRCSISATPNGLLASFSDWYHYAVRAPESRLSNLVYAACGEQQTLIIGELLPPLPGQRLVENNHVIVTAGWQLFPAISAELIHRSLGISNDDYALFSPKRPWQRINSSDLVGASRSSVRHTATTYDW